MTEALDERVLVWAPRGRDGALAVQLLHKHGFVATAVGSLRELCEEIERGSGCAILTEEMLQPFVLRRLGELLAHQPPWSDYPLLVFSASPRPSASADLAAALGNVAYLERPVRVRNLLAAVRTALRGRSRQYAARAEIERRDEFLAMLGHELRNPLAAIVFASGMAARATDPVDFRRQSAIVDRQARHLGRLVDDLLDVSRVTRGKVTLRREAIDLIELARRAVREIEFAAAAKNHVVEVVTDLHTLVVDGDPVRFEQILSNLLTNAVKYTPQGGHIKVEVAQEGADAVLRVRDDGIGIEPGMLSSIFEPFAQMTSALDRSEGGLGLGLTLVRSLVQMHGGDVVAQSDGPARGTVFIVRVPASVQAFPEALRKEPAPTEPLDVVLIDDNEDMREMMVEFLRAAGHRVQHASDGIAGLSVILDRAPDVAIIDIGLPGLDGLEVARRVRAALGREIRLVAITGYGQPEDRARSDAAGYDVHLVKPTSPDELLASLEVAPAQ